MLARLSLIAVLVCTFTLARDARAECNCVAVAGEVAASVQAEVAKADGLYARGDFNGALEIYAKAYASSKDPALLYAQGMANWQLGEEHDLDAGAVGCEHLLLHAADWQRVAAQIDLAGD